MSKTRDLADLLASGDLEFTGGLNVDSGTLFVDEANNRVGVGTTSPSEKLDVAGDAEINGLIVGRGGGNDDRNTAVGLRALNSNTSGESNSAFGRDALRFNTTGTDNTANGFLALRSNTAGNRNTATGYQAMFNNVDGGGNTADGFFTLHQNDSGDDNVAVGFEALQLNTTGSNNVAVGRQALENNLSDNNTAVGKRSLLNNTTGTFNASFGLNSAQSLTTGIRNTCIGAETDGPTTGSSNCFVGHGAGYFMTTGSSNTILGSHNGNKNGLDIRTSNNNIVLSDGDGNPRLFYNSSRDAWFSSGENSADTYWPFVPSSSGVDAVMIRNSPAQLTVSTSSSSPPFALDRNSSDGDLVRFYQAGNEEGSISVSGTTVSYNGGHLSRWSRLPDDSKDVAIVKGTVMTNLDEMVEWGDEDNEQLNKMAVSSVEGDVNVAGVFVNWDEDDDWNDMNVAMTGDMVIRIAQNTTVQRGDLLVSAGDGTAKPQDDDIVRSKTIAKVTSTSVSHTYDDGSYLVPCVLMAC